jgi:hypothetical protein
MKTLSLISSCCFGVLAAASALIAMDAHRGDLGWLALVCAVLSVVLWHDYQNEHNTR